MPLALHENVVEREAITRMPLFLGIADWPNLNEGLEQEARRIIRDHGFREFLKSGGKFHQEAGFTFDPLGLISETVFSEFIQSHRGFIWQDEQGRTSAVALAGIPRCSRDDRGYAISWHDSVIALDPLRRRAAAQKATKWLDDQRARDDQIPPGKLLDQSFLRRELHVARQIDLGLDCLSLIADEIEAAEGQSDIAICSDRLWPVDNRPSNWVICLEGAIGTMMSLKVQKLRWEHPVWTPEIMATGSAITEFQPGSRDWHIRACSFLVEALRAFHWAGEPEEGP